MIEVEVIYRHNEICSSQRGDIENWIKEGHFWGLRDSLSAKEYKSFLVLLRCENFTSITFGDDDFGWTIVKTVEP